MPAVPQLDNASAIAGPSAMNVGSLNATLEDESSSESDKKDDFSKVIRLFTSYLTRRYFHSSPGFSILTNLVLHILTKLTDNSKSRLPSCHC